MVYRKRIEGVLLMEKQFEELGMTEKEVEEFLKGLEEYLDKRED